MEQNLNPSEEKWRELGRQAINEQDHEKLLILIQQIIATYNEVTPKARPAIAN